MPDIANLVIRVDHKGVEGANRELDRLPDKGAKAERATDGVARAFKRLLTAAVALQAIRYTTGLIADFEESMSGVKAVTQATSDQMIELTAVARQLGADTRFSARQAAEGMRFLGMAGFTTEQIIAAMPGMLDLATAGMLDLGQAADIASNIMSGFNLEAAQSTRVADTLAAAASASNTNVAQLGDAMKYVAPIAAGMGVSVEDAAAAIGVLSSAGIQGTMAGTGLRQVLSSLATPTKEAADILDAYGLSIREVNPETNSLTEILTRLREAGLSATDALVIAGDRGGNSLQALVANVPNLERMNGVMATSTGRAKEMSRVMNDNLKGDFLQLKSATEELVLKLGDAGLRNELRQGTQALTEFTRAVNDIAASGELEAWIDLVLYKLSLLGDGFVNASENISYVWGETVEYVNGDAANMRDDIIDAFTQIPENVRAVVQIIGATIGTLVNFAGAGADAVYEVFASQFNFLLKTATNVFDEIGDQISHPFSKGTHDFAQQQIAITDEMASRVVESWDDVTAGINAAGQAHVEVINSILDERDAELAAGDARLAKIRELREGYAKLKAEQAARAAERDKNAGVPSVAGAPGGGDSSRFNVQEFENLKKQLQLEEKSIQSSYERRLELIRLNTQEGSAIRFELEEALDAQLNAEMARAATDRLQRAKDLQEQMNEAIADGRLEDLDSLRQQLEFEETAIHDSYLRRRQQILDDQTLTDQERLDLLTKNESDYTARMRQLETQRTKMVLQNSQDLFSSLSEAFKNSVGEQNSLYKVAFAASKAFAIAESIIKIQQGIASAAATPFPGNIAAMASVAAATASILSNIQETRLAFEHGGMIPSGAVGLVGEAGPELVRGPAIVSSARATADLGRRDTQPTKVSVVVNNFTDASVEVKERDNGDGKVLELIVRRAKTELSSDIARGGSAIAKSLEQTYGLRRGAA